MTFSPEEMGRAPQQLHLELIEALQARVGYWHKFFISTPASQPKSNRHYEFAEEFPGLVYNTLLLTGLSKEALGKEIGVTSHIIDRYISKASVPQNTAPCEILSQMREVLFIKKHELSPRPTSGHHLKPSGP